MRSSPKDISSASPVAPGHRGRICTSHRGCISPSGRRSRSASCRTSEHLLARKLPAQQLSLVSFREATSYGNYPAVLVSSAQKQACQVTWWIMRCGCSSHQEGPRQLAPSACVSLTCQSGTAPACSGEQAFNQHMQSLEDPN